MLKLPERLEREFAGFRMRIDSDVASVVDMALTKQQLRQDDENHPDLLAMIALLGLSARGILNERLLRKRLRRIARTLSREKQAEFTTLLGRFVQQPSEATLNLWVDEQTKYIQEATRAWLAAAAVIVAGTAGGIQVQRNAVLATVPALQRRSVFAASAGILGLQALIVPEVSVANGLTHYKWVTEGDDRVRDHHAALNGTIQSWSDPPIGGGTYEDEPGHPLSGYGCRCLAQPIPQ